MTDLSPLVLDLPPIRPARLPDAEAIAAVHVRAWQQTYGGLLPDARVNRQTEADRARLWRDVLGRDRAAPVVLLAVPAGEVAGFLCLGPQRSSRLAAMGYDAEISAIYLLATAQGRGLGRALMCAAVHCLLDRRGRALSLWALAANARACEFYRALGAAEIAERTDEDGRQLAFGWDDPAVLL